MKWLDSLAAWCTVLDSTGESGVDELIKYGEFFPSTQMIVVGSENLSELCQSLSALQAPPDLLQFANGIAKEHRLSRQSFSMRVEPDPINIGWQKQCEFLFLRRVLLNWRSVLCIQNSRLALEYVGQSWTSMDILSKSNLTSKELAIVVFQLLWTFAALARCQLFLPIENWTTFFEKVFVQKNRLDYFGEQNNNETVFFLRGNSLKDAEGVFRVPVRNAFVHITYEPPTAISFGHEVYDIGDKLAPVEHMCYNANFDRSRVGTVTESTFFASFAHQLCNFFFPQGLPADEEIVHLFTGLQSIANAKESVYEFLYGQIATPYWMKFKADDRHSIIRVLAMERTLSVLFLPMPVERRAVHRRAFRSDCVGFPNIENNCFLNSVLFMLMFPNRLKNSFAQTVELYANMPQPTEQESETVRALKGLLTDAQELERMRRILARFFSSAFQKAFLLSNSAESSQQSMSIYKECSNLLPLLDLWSLAVRGQFFARVAGEYQDLDECLRLLHSLLLFESCTTSTVAITEEFPTLLFSDAEKMSMDDIEQLSLKEKNNPLCLRVQSNLESPILRHDWSSLGENQNAAIELQSICGLHFDCSVVPSPLSPEQKDFEKKSGIKYQRSTRFNLKRIMRSKDSKMVIIHIFRQSMTFINDRVTYTIKPNPVIFPADETLLIDGRSMRVHSLVLWSNSHYTSLVFCEKTRHWWHVNDILSVGRRFQDFGADLNSAIALVNNFGMIVTTITCFPTAEQTAVRELEQQCFIELPKFCPSSDSMLAKAILFHKDEQRLVSARSVISLISEPVFELPNRFLFGHDNPNDDFIFRPEWFNGEPLVSQQPGILLIIASGFAPEIQHSLDIPLDHLAILEQRISKMSCITIRSKLEIAKERAVKNLDTINCLRTGQVLSAKQFVNFINALNAFLINCDAKKFIEDGGETNAWLKRGAQSWIIDPVLMTVLMSDAMPLHARNTLAANYLRRSEDYVLGPYYQLQKIIFPFYAAGQGFVVLVEPSKHQIAFFDPFRKVDDTSSIWITLFLVHLQKTFWSQPRAKKEDWITTHVLIDQSFATLNADFVILHICREIISGRETNLFEPLESREKSTHALMRLLQQVGDIKKT